MAKESKEVRIEFAGFKKIDDSSMIIVRASAERYARKLASYAKKMEYLHITLKTLHEREKGEIYDIKARLKDGGSIYTSHSSDRNLFVAVDGALQKLHNELD